MDRFSLPLFPSDRFHQTIFTLVLFPEKGIFFISQWRRSPAAILSSNIEPAITITDTKVGMRMIAPWWKTVLF